MQRAVPTASTKARQNQEALDEAVYLYSEDPEERRGLKGLGQAEETSSEANASNGDTCPAEPAWQANARLPTAPRSDDLNKSRSQPLRKVQNKAAGSGMQYRPRDNVPADASIASTELGAKAKAALQGDRTEKTRSQPFRKVKPRTGITFPVGINPSVTSAGQNPTGPISGVTDAAPLGLCHVLGWHWECANTVVY